MKLFDLQPKYSRKDLFDRTRELSELHRAIDRGYPIVALLGIRRIGKTSVLKTFLNEVYGIYVDLRGVVRRADLEVKVTDSISSSLRKVRKFVEGIRGVSVAGFSVEIKWRGSDSVSLAGLLSEINKKKKRFVVALDEVQSVKPPLSAELRNLLAYGYDNLENISFIVAGSEIGMLRDFLGCENPGSPLYGRYIYEIHIDRFSEKESREFLERGFREEGVEPPAEVIDQAVEFFDGIVGWLVFFGRKYVDGYRDIETLKNIAVELAREELTKLNYRERAVLKAIASGHRTWSSVRKHITENYGVTIPKATLTRIVTKLERLSIVKNYEFQDPVYREASKKLRP
ncbi:MAG: ATP-binding protein [Zestosphaera sp.]